MIPRPNALRPDPDHEAGPRLIERRANDEESAAEQVETLELLMRALNESNRRRTLWTDITF